ncbi:glycosyltransferase family 2 protein [Mobiluncus mulieris]|uniref:Glycosyltransferase family 2 protein n=1 Tax=Mobiluncus mulieris TaxID=2052 RepID=A0A7Y0Y4H0_9ACTO|nr:glycosyltransferase [Mobiluncus mulieris]NMW65315.1 glycosyltransferase family 2 protein [Mobiluncus mulieris]
MPLEVSAFVVTSGETPYLAATLLAVSRQTTPLKSVYVIDVSTSGVARRVGTQILTAPGARNLGAALEQARLSPDFPKLESGAAIWLLHDDSAPDATCLEEQLRVFAASDDTVVVGAKQRAWDKAAQLLEVGIQATASGRRLQEMDAGEIDQGQYDGRSDVLAVGTAAMLVDWDTYLELEGFDPQLGSFGDGLEFCRRVHLAGYRVQVAPRAVVYHKLAGYYGLRGPDGGRPTRATRLAEEKDALEPEPKRSFTPRRVAQLHNWLVAAPWWQFIFLPLVVLILGVIRIGWRIVTKEPKLAAGELKATLVTVFHPVGVWRARLKRARHQRVPSRALKPLQIKGRQIWQAKVTLRKIAKDARKPLITDQQARQNYIIEKNIDAGLSLVVALILLMISLLAGRFALGGVAGGALPSLPEASSEFWAHLISGWLPAGLGYGSQILAADPLGLLLGILGVCLGTVGIKSPVILAILGFATLPVAWLAAWWAAAVMTTSRPLRITAALSWVLSPALLASLGAGQISGWILAWAIPLFAGALARASGAGHTRIVMGDGNEPVEITVESARIIQAGLAALAGFVAVCAAQVLIVPLVLLLGLGFMRGVSRIPADYSPSGLSPHEAAPKASQALKATHARLAFRHLLIILLPSAWLVLPMLLRTLSHPNQWPLWVSTLGVPQESPTPNWMDLLTGWPLSLRQVHLALPLPGWQWLAVAPVLLALIVTLVSVVVPGHSLASHWAVILALCGLAIAGLSGVTPVAVHEAHAVTAWAGPGLAVYHAGLLTAAVTFWNRLRLDTPLQVAGWVEKTCRVGLAVAVFIPVVGVAPGLISEIVHPRASDFGRLQAFHEEMLPATVVNGQTGPQQQRCLNLVVQAAPNQSILVEASVWRGWRDTVFEAAPWVKLKNYQNVSGTRSPDAADTVLSQTVAAVLGGDTPRLSEQLASLDIHFIVVANGDSEPVRHLVNLLDSTADLERVTQTAAGTVWRLGDDNQAGLVRVASAHWIGGRPSWPTEKNQAMALSGRVPGQVALPAGSEGRLMALSERRDANFMLHLDGKPLSAVDNGQWNNLYRLPGGKGSLQIRYAYLPYQLWGAVLVLWLFIAFAAALPLRRVSEVKV